MVARKPVRHLVAGGALCAGLALAARPGQAQVLTNIVLPSIPAYDTDPGVTVLSRSHPEFESQGVRLGSFVLRPSLTESGGYNDNVLATGVPSPSGVFDTSASVGLNSDWSRDSVGILASVDDTRYLQLPGLDQTSYTFAAGGTYDIGRDALTVAATELKAYEQLGGIDVFNSEVPIPYTITDIRANYLTTVGRFSFRPAVDYSQYRFSSYNTGGLQFDGPTNSVNSAEVSLTTEYELAPLRNLVLTLEGANLHYLASLPNTPTRDSNGGSALFGIDYAANSILRYYLLGGVQVRSYTNAVYRSETAPIVSAGVVWTPTGLTTITASVDRHIEDSTDQTVIGYTLTDGSAQINHEYLRNVILNAHFTASNAIYQQASLSQTYYGVGGGVSWLLNRNTTLQATYDFSSGPPPIVHQAAFSRNVVLLRVNFHL